MPEGLIAGHLLRLIREHLGLTQHAAAEALHVDINTLRSWETGRRPLANVKVGQLLQILRQLQGMGANPLLLDHLTVAINADLFFPHVVMEATRGDPAQHVLAGWVSTRTWNDLLAWALIGTPPKALGNLVLPGQRRNPTPAQPEFPKAARTKLFDALRITADRAMARPGDPAAVLLRRQAYFMAAWDDTPAGRDWLVRAERAELRHLRGNGWTPTWVARRSLAVARACQGDREQLRQFIATQLTDDRCEAANLNYWAYWVGETAGVATSDEFMAAGLGPWRGTSLLRHLTEGLRATTPYVDLSVHTAWALLGRRPHLLSDDPALTAELGKRVTELLDGEGELSPDARRELSQIQFVTAARGPR